MRNSLIKINHRYRGHTELEKVLNFIGEVTHASINLHKHMAINNSQIDSYRRFYLSGAADANTVNLDASSIINSQQYTFQHYKQEPNDIQSIQNRIGMLEDKIQSYRQHI